MPTTSASSIVLDVGTGYTKMGFAGNQLPSFVIPSAIAARSGPGTSSSGGRAAPPPPSKPSSLSSTGGGGSGGAGGGGGGASSNLASKRGVEDLDFFIGDEALAAGRGHGYGVHYPVRHGLIENWDLMEKYWQQCIFKYLRAEPEDHCFLLVSGNSKKLARLEQSGSEEQRRSAQLHSESAEQMCPVGQACKLAAK